MRSPARILAVDDVAENLDIVRMRLEANGYEVVTAADGEEALTQARAHMPDLILLDIMMPKLDGLSVLKTLKEDQRFGFIPVILLTAKADRTDVVAGLDAGGDDYLTKPFDQAALISRVRAMLRIKALHDIVQDQAAQLAEQTKQLESWNQSLTERVADQVTEIEKMGRLKRFLSPQVADVIAASGEQENLLLSHRREVTALFCDLRGFTAFTELAEPEEVIAVLHEFHHELGQLIDLYEGTLERFVGDGLLTLFNDPIICPDHTNRAVRMAIEMQEKVDVLTKTWRKRGHDLGFGIGIARGYATLGKIGFERRFDYAAVGTVINLASRLCDEAKPGQILIDQRVFNVIEDSFEAKSIGILTVKGLRRSVEAFEIIAARS